MLFLKNIQYLSRSKYYKNPSYRPSIITSKNITNILIRFNPSLILFWRFNLLKNDIYNHVKLKINIQAINLKTL